MFQEYRKEIEWGGQKLVLESGKVAGVGLDVFSEEPPKHSSLLTHENVLSSPHIAGNDAPAIEGLSRCAVDNLLAIGRGEWPEGCINKDGLKP